MTNSGVVLQLQYTRPQVPYLFRCPTVLLGYSVEPEFCASSSEFTTVAVPLALVSPLVLAGVADGRTHR